MQAVAERVPVMGRAEIQDGRRAILRVVTAIQLGKVVERLNKKK